MRRAELSCAVLRKERRETLEGKEAKRGSRCRASSSVTGHHYGPPLAPFGREYEKLILLLSSLFVCVLLHFLFPRDIKNYNRRL